MTQVAPRTFSREVDAAGLLGGTRFLYAGEFHYFRVSRPLWRERLQQMRDVGLNGVSIYIPWNWHMPSADVLDLTGETLPERDLVGCLEDIAAVGLTCVFRPGPFITAEWRNGGLPDWLFEEHPAILGLDASGTTTGAPGDYPVVTYAHPQYMSASAAWLEAAFGAARPFLAGNGGPIINVQIDDEPSYWDTLTRPLLSDYNPHLVAPLEGEPSRYAEFLLERYGSLGAVNAAHRCDFSSPEEIDPPRTMMESPDELVRYLDWHDFKILQINEHCAFLYEIIRAAGVHEPISMLFPYLLPLQARQFSRFMTERGLGDIWLTNECYLALFDSAAISEHKVGSVVATHDSYHMWRQGSAGPPITMELQGSNASYITPGSMEMLYALTIARGIRGISYFMMVGGENPAGYEHISGRGYDISAPISPDGHERPHCAVIRKLGRIIDTAESVILSAEPSHDVWCGYYLPYEPAAIAGAGGGMPAARDLVQRLFFAGDMGTSTTPSVQTLMALSSVTQGSLDLETATDDELAVAGQLWILSLDFMSDDVQRKLLRYVESGGHLVVLPGLPSTDEAGQDCTVLLDAAFPSGTECPTFPATQAISTPTYSIIRSSHGQVLSAPGATSALPEPAEEAGSVLARNSETGVPCAVSYAVGGGTMSVLGFRLGYNPNEETDHKDFLVSLVEDTTGPRTSWTSNPHLAAMQLSGDNGGLVCLVNPTPLPGATKVHWSPDDVAPGVRSIFPTQIEAIIMPELGAKLLPVQRRLRAGGELRYATWELLEETDDGILVFATLGTGEGEVALTGDVNLTAVTDGELVFSTRTDDGLVIVARPWGPEIRLTLSATPT